MATWAASPSRVARTTWAGEVWSPRPSRVPVADGRQYGAPSPARAGTTVTPAASGTDVATSSRSARSRNRPMATSHDTAAPAV